MTREETNADSETDDSRRRFLAGTAGAIGGAFATPPVATAHTDGDETDDDPPEAVESEFEDDVAVLNYALTLEYFEAAFYEHALDNISEADPVDELEFDFGSAVEEPDELLATAVQLEDTGVGAYAGAAPYIEDGSLVPPALILPAISS